MAWRDSLPALVERNKVERAFRNSLTREWDRRAAFNRVARRKALKVLEDSRKLSAKEMAVVRDALV